VIFSFILSLLFVVDLEMTQFQTIVSGFIQHIEGISSEVEKEKLKVSKIFMAWYFCGSVLIVAFKRSLYQHCQLYGISLHTIIPLLWKGVIVI